MAVDNLLENFGVSGLVAIIILGISLLTYVIVKIYQRIIQDKLKPLSEAINAEIKSSLFGGTYLSILNYGPEIRLKVTLGGKDSPPLLSLKLLNAPGVSFKITKKNTLQQIFFKRGDEVKLEEDSLDGELAIRSDKPYETKSYLMEPKRKEVIQYFFENGFNEIKTDPKGIIVKKINYSDNDLTPENVRTYLEKLNSFTFM